MAMLASGRTGGAEEAGGAEGEGGSSGGRTTGGGRRGSYRGEAGKAGRRMAGWAVDWRLGRRVEVEVISESCLVDSVMYQREREQNIRGRKKSL
jgi:hypothetical protein